MWAQHRPIAIALRVGADTPALAFGQNSLTVFTDNLRGRSE